MNILDWIFALPATATDPVAIKAESDVSPPQDLETIDTQLALWCPDIFNSSPEFVQIPKPEDEFRPRQETPDVKLPVGQSDDFRPRRGTADVKLPVGHSSCSPRDYEVFGEAFDEYRCCLLTELHRLLPTPIPATSWGCLQLCDIEALELIVQLANTGDRCLVAVTLDTHPERSKIVEICEENYLTLCRLTC
jgi:hypothetical protein